MNLNEQLQQAYEAGRRQALNEQAVRPPGGFVHPLWQGASPWVDKQSAKWDMWRKIADAKRSGNQGLLKKLLKDAVRRGVITSATSTQLLGAGSFAAFISILAAIIGAAAVAAIGYGAFVAPGFRGLDPSVEFGSNSGIHPDVLAARHPKSVGSNPLKPHH